MVLYPILVYHSATQIKINLFNLINGKVLASRLLYKKVALEATKRSWYCIVDNIRTVFQNTTQDAYIPDLLSKEYLYTLTAKSPVKS